MCRCWRAASLGTCGVLLLGAACWLAWKGWPRPREPFPEEPASDLAIDYDAGQVVRRDPSGGVSGATPLEGDLGRARPPHLLADADRVYVTHGDGVTALDRRTGTVLWPSPG